METNTNSEVLNQQLTWLKERVFLFATQAYENNAPMPGAPADSAFARFTGTYQLSHNDKIVLLTALAASIRPEVFAPFVPLFLSPKMEKSCGGVYQASHAEFCPTLRTAFFLIAGGRTDVMMDCHHVYHRKHPLFTSGIIKLSETDNQKKITNHLVEFNEQFLPAIIYGQAPRLDGDLGFPATQSTSTHTLADVALNDKAHGELKKIQRFVRRAQTLWQLPDASKYRQNFIAIFTGDPGTGKSHTAEAIGNEFKLPVYQVNLAQMIDKYIGETEKNLEKVFNRFNGQPCVLFFDEAEAIFSKRTEVSDSHDKYANNTQSYLLQAIEKFKGLIILATNVKNTDGFFDPAFQRRIRQVVKFEFPDYPERLKIWQNGLGKSFVYADGLAEDMAKNYQLNGGSIYNIISDAVLEALDRQTDTITFDAMEETLNNEFIKSGRKTERVSDEAAKNIYNARYGHRELIGGNGLTTKYKLP